MREARSNSVRHWETFYRGGALASCPLGPGKGYTLELRDVWIDFFSALAEGSRILDVGTGNGAIALIARQVASFLGRNFCIHGTDLANIDPVRNVTEGARLFAGVRFYPMVATEELPFESGSLDAVSAHYSIEYTDTGRALAEIRRVLRSGAPAQFVMHHADSIVASKARESLEQVALVLDRTRILRLLRRHLDAGPRSRAARDRAAADLDAALETLRSAAGKAHGRLVLDVVIDAVRQLRASTPELTPAALLQEVSRVESDVRDAARRLEDLLRYSRTREQIDEFAQCARDAGFRKVEVATQHHAGTHLVGWRLRLG